MCARLWWRFARHVATLDQAGHRAYMKLVGYFDKTRDIEVGGDGSSRWGGHVAKPLVEDGLRLDLQALRRAGLLREGRSAPGALSWTNSETGETEASIGVQVDMRDLENCFVVLRYTAVPPGGEAEEIESRIDLMSSQLNYGGKRWWFRCPVSGRRVAKLYAPPQSALFASRQAHGLGYRTQRMVAYQRAQAKVRRVQRRLGGSASLTVPFPPRPKGMWWTTYARLRTQAIEAQVASLQGLDRVLLRLSRRR